MGGRLVVGGGTVLRETELLYSYIYVNLAFDFGVLTAPNCSAIREEFVAIDSTEQADLPLFSFRDF